MTEENAPLAPTSSFIKTLREKLYYQGWLTVKDMVFQIPCLKDEKQTREMQREVLVTNDAAVVLTYVPQIDSFLLTQEYRAGVICNRFNDDDPFIYQCVAGQIEQGMSAEDTACAELEEEAGIKCTPEDLEPITALYASPGQMTEKVHLFLARLPYIPKTGIFGNAHENEYIKTSLITREALYRLADEGGLVDCMTFLALSWFRAHNKENSQDK